MRSSGKGIWGNSKEWVSGTIKKIWKQEEQNQNKQQQSCHIQNVNIKNTRKQSQAAKKLCVLDKLRGPAIQKNLSVKLKKINEFFQDKSQEQKPLELACPICIDYYCLPVTTACGHTFCYQCLDQSLLLTPNCPVCRQYIRGTHLSKCHNLQIIVARHSLKCENPQQKQLYQKNKLNSLEWQIKRNIKPEQVKVFDYIDVRDTEFIWCQAQIKQIYYKNENKHSVLVHYLGWNSVYDQIIQLNSQRLANYKFYTQRKQIPHYRMDESNAESMHNYVLVGQDPPNFINILQQQILNIQRQMQIQFQNAFENQNPFLPQIPQLQQQSEQINSVNNHFPDFSEEQQDQVANIQFGIGQSVQIELNQQISYEQQIAHQLDLPIFNPDQQFF